MQTDMIPHPATPATGLESPPLARAKTIPFRWYRDPASDPLDQAEAGTGRASWP